MTLLVLGLNHKTAPIALRERVTFSSEKLRLALRNLLSHKVVHSTVMLSTCNRTELYTSTEKRHDPLESLVSWICNYHRIEDNIYENIYFHRDENAVSHLMRVASGLDSLVLGETQIFGQVKKAFLNARKYHTMSNELERMFQNTFSAVKRIRTETMIGDSSVSIASTACKLACQIFDVLPKIKVLLLGAGNTIRLVAYHLMEHGVEQLTIANRTLSNASILARSIGAEAISLCEISQRIAEADLIISSTSSLNPIINENMMRRAVEDRRNQPVLLLDIAVPRDIEPEVSGIPNVYLYSIDDLKVIIDKNIAQREASAKQAEVIINQETRNFMAWLRSQDAISIIRDYRDHANSIRSKLELRAMVALQRGDDPEIVLKELGHRLTNSLIHTPTKSIQCAARDGDSDRLSLLRNSLGIN